MKFIFCFYLLVSQLAFSYTAGDINLNGSEYQRYVRPQLININQDFVTLVIQLNPELKESKSIFNYFKNLNEITEQLKDKCSHEQNDICISKIKQAIQIVGSISRLSLNSPTLTNKENFTADNLIESFQDFYKYKSKLNDLNLTLENYLFFEQAKIHKLKNINDISTLIYEVENNFYVYINSSSDNRFKDEFLSFWNDVYRPLNYIISTELSKEAFVRRINDLNLRINILNVTLTKRHHNISKQAITILGTIHNRWNNVLKVTLR